MTGLMGAKSASASMNLFKMLTEKGKTGAPGERNRIDLPATASPSAMATGKGRKRARTPMSPVDDAESRYRYG
jgi:hypothetical protein